MEEDGCKSIAGSGSVVLHGVLSEWTARDLGILFRHSLGGRFTVQDKSNIGNARVAGLQKELRMTDYEVSLSPNPLSYSAKLTHAAFTV